MEKKIFAYLKDKYKSWSWIGQRAHDGLALNHALGLDLIMSCDYGTEIREFYSGNCIALEQFSPARRNWSNDDLDRSLDSEAGQAFRAFLDQSEERLNAICYRSFSSLEECAAYDPQKLAIFSSYAHLKRYFDDKVRFQKKIAQIGLPSIPGYTTVLGSEDFKTLSEKLYTPFVIQFPFGSSGSHTFIIMNASAFHELKRTYPHQQVNAMRYIPGVSANVNAIITGTGADTKILSSFPSLQLIGLESCSNSPTTFCGNDFTGMQDFDEKIHSKIAETAVQVGQWMATEGFRGMFGIDLIIDGDTVYPLEINPRFQNSTGLFTALEIFEKQIPSLVLFHLAAFFAEDRELQKRMNMLDKNRLFDPLNGSQIILHAPTMKTKVTGDCKPGIYTFNNDRLTFNRSSAAIWDCSGEEEILVTCGVPEKEKALYPGAPICKVQVRSGVLGGNKISLNQKSNTIVKRIYDMLELVPSNDESERDEHAQKRREILHDRV